MRLLNREQSFELDRKAVSEYHFSIRQLINQAAAALLDAFSLIVSNEEKNQKVIFLVGPGNNGQDAFHMKKLFEVKFPTVKVELYQYEELDLFLSSPLPERAVVIDGLFGMGLNRKLSDIVIKVIHKINQNSEIFKVVSIDVPSGLDSNTGLIYGACIKADFTLACELPKVGCFLNHGPYYSGKIKSVSIGFPETLVKDTAKNFRLIQRKIAQRIFPKRSVLTNKSKQGHLLIIAGSLKMPGALRLCSLAAARMGVGYVTIALDSNWFSDARGLLNLFPDFILITKSELLSSDDNELKKRYTGILFGPGLEPHSIHKDLLKKILKLNIKILIDAEGINTLNEKSNFLEKDFVLHENCLVTPHAGELSRIINISAKEIEDDRIRACKVFSNTEPAVILLKGHKTVIHSKEKYYIVCSGNKALAKAGTGDVLAGIISSFFAQGLDIEKAACLGAYIHGDIADQWVRDGNSVNSLMASDLLEGLKSYQADQRSITDK